MAELALALADSIEEVSRQCRSALQECVGVPSLMEYEWAENRLAEFNLWTAMTGAFAGEKASLDARLAHEWETKYLVTNVLFLLLGCVKKCQGQTSLPEPEALDGSDESEHSDEFQSDSGESEEEREDSLDIPPIDVPRAFSPWSDQSSVDSALEEQMFDDDQHDLNQNESLVQEAKKEVEQILDHLSRLAIAIRKSGSNSRAYKADKLFKPDRHLRLRKHLTVVVLARGSEGGRDVYSFEDGSLTTVQERLILANLRRRNRYLYAQKHARKLAAEAPLQRRTTAPSQIDHAPVVTEVDATSQAPGPEEEEETVPAPEPSTPSLHLANPQAHRPLRHAVLTATSASAVAQTIEPVPQHAVTPSQVAKTNITATTAKILYPRPPKARDGMRYFTCPCCAQTLPEMFRQTSLWKKHLMSDICPYTCIVEDCPMPDRLFVTRREWTKHVENDHQQCWQCPPCTVPGRPPLVFPSVDGLVNHLNEAHAETISEAQHTTIVADSVRPVPSGISSCPLCDSTGPADSPEILDHIAEHLHAFALRSLPWARDDKTREPEEDEDNDDLDDDYFAGGGYFDEGTEDHSQQDNVFTDSERDSAGLASLPSNTSRVSSPESPTVPEPLSAEPDADHNMGDILASIERNSNLMAPEPVNPGMMPEIMPERRGNGTELEESTIKLFESLLDAMAWKHHMEKRSEGPLPSGAQVQLDPDDHGRYFTNFSTMHNVPVKGQMPPSFSNPDGSENTPSMVDAAHSAQHPLGKAVVSGTSAEYSGVKDPPFRPGPDVDPYISPDDYFYDPPILQRPDPSNAPQDEDETDPPPEKPAAEGSSGPGATAGAAAGADASGPSSETNKSKRSKRESLRNWWGKLRGEAATPIEPPKEELVPTEPPLPEVAPFVSQAYSVQVREEEDLPDMNWLSGDERWKGTPPRRVWGPGPAYPKAKVDKETARRFAHRAQDQYRERPGPKVIRWDNVGHPRPSNGTEPLVGTRTVWGFPSDLEEEEDKAHEAEGGGDKDVGGEEKTSEEKKTDGERPSETGPSSSEDPNTGPDVASG